jgi:polyisoprenoid-binding protein YceI
MPETTSAAAVQIPAVGTYQPDPAASTVKFATGHLFGLALVKGTFRLISGQVTIADPVTSSTASAVIDAASLPPVIRGVTRTSSRPDSCT